jgi:hypothetical protein
VAVAKQYVLSWMSELSSCKVHSTLYSHGIIAYVNEAILDENVSTRVRILIHTVTLSSEVGRHRYLVCSHSLCRRNSGHDALELLY